MLEANGREGRRKRGAGGDGKCSSGEGRGIEVGMKGIGWDGGDLGWE